ncbi:MAG: hypothetical protein LUC93_10560 [Planctomycetaceae bacterium]|nr:hypothetical protein [Planctomycetaceae bacterium]
MDTLIFGLMMVAALSACTPVYAEDRTAAAAWWLQGETRRDDSGSVAQHLVLRLPPEAGDIAEVECFVRQAAIAAYNQGESDDFVSWQRLSARRGPNGMVSLTVEADRYCRTTVWATIPLPGGVAWAQTIFNQYGKVAEPAPAVAATMDPPAFSLSSSGEDYWPQTGHTFTATPGWDGAVERIDVVDEAGGILHRSIDHTGPVSYTPPHDPALDSAGDRAKKHFVFLAISPGGNETHSLSVAVHRSRSGNIDLPTGLLIGAVAMAVSLFVAVRLRAARAIE